MLKVIMAILAIAFFAQRAMADDSVCKPMATLAKMSAEQRDKGLSQDTFLKHLVREGKLDPQDSSAPFVINTVVWVYEENVSAKSAYKQMYEKCRSAFSKKR
jgi:TRAP-type uncharacterized transport system substrate-binding protein